MGIVLFAGALVVACVVGHFAGFWSSLAPFVLHNGGPLGLDGAFAANLVAGVALSSTQVLFTYAIVRYGLGREERKRRARDRAEFCREFAHLYIRVTETYRRWQKQIPSERQQEFIRTKDQLKALLRRYERDLDYDEKEAVLRVERSYDEVILHWKWDALETIATDARRLFHRLLPEPFGEWTKRQLHRGRMAAWQRLYEDFIAPIRALAQHLRSIPDAERAAMVASGATEAAEYSIGPTIPAL